MLIMGKHNIAQALILLLNFGSLLPSLACPYTHCPFRSRPPNLSYSLNPPIGYPYLRPPIGYPYFRPRPPLPCPYKNCPFRSRPPITYPHLRPNLPFVDPPITPKPPINPKPPVVTPPKPTVTPKPPVVSPPLVPKPPPKPPSQPKETPRPPPTSPLQPKPHRTCPIHAVKLGACVDVLGGLVHIGIGGSRTKDVCCPVLKGLVDVDAALCLCTTIKAKLRNIKILLPIALEVLVRCGKTPPSGFQCPA